MVAARFLHGWGADVSIVLSHRPDPARGVAARQLAILDRMGLRVVEANAQTGLAAADLVIDALLGFSMTGAPAGTTATLIRAANAQAAHSPVLAVDLPSGLLATEGTPLDPCVRAAATLTLALPKTGLLTEAGRAVAGKIGVADIGVPSEVYGRFGLEIGPLFARGDLVDLI
jgi:NAD(P)H-hydrate epimerase